MMKDEARAAYDEINSADGLTNDDAYRLYTALGGDDFDKGWTYNPDDADWLVAIHTRFVSTYHALREAQEEDRDDYR